MSGRCQQCSASTTWDDNVGSAVCTSCGSLEDPSQSVLTSSLYDNQNAALEPSLWDSSASTTLKSLRAGNNWDLAGQGKESRDRKNSYAIAEFIKSLAVSFNATGLSPRAITLFNQTKSANYFRWGQKSKFVAAACLAIALRESNRPDSLRDIASILNTSSASIIREFTNIISTLNLTLSLVDPSVHMSTLQAHLASALEGNQTEHPLPVSLVKSLHALSLRSAHNTAVSLNQVFARLSPHHDILRLPAAPTACGMFLLALEAENRSLLNPLGDLAQFLASRCHASKSVVMARYKTIQDEVAVWAETVPWLDTYKRRSGRAKVSKRLIVARSLKDVILFQDSVWEQQTKPSLDLEFSEDENECADEFTNKHGHSSRRSQGSSKHSKKNNVMSQATRFLLDPLGTSISSKNKSSPSSLVSHLPFATYALVNPAEASAYRTPTRLQILALDRGGATEEHIPDEDLFIEGELEKLFRGDEEIAVLRKTFGWMESEVQEEQDPHSATTTISTKTRKKRKESVMEDGIIHGTALSPRKKSRLNMEALARFMVNREENTPSEDDTFDANIMGLLDGAMSDSDEEACDDIQHGNRFTYGSGPDIGNDDDNTVVSKSLSSIHQHLDRNIQQLPMHDEDEGVILQHWSPPSPSLEHIVSDSRYEEERPP